MGDLRVTVDDLEFTATWTDDAPDTRAAIADCLPLSGVAARWGDELYFDVPVEAAPDTTRTTVEPGTVAYWPDGPALCLFWGPTPASTDDRPAAASPVAVIARLADPDRLADIDGGAEVRIESAD